MSDEQEITAPLETESLQAGWAEKALARPALYAYLQLGAKTDLGQVRENNEDKFDFLEPDDPVALALKGRAYAVADGMGGHSAGQIAAELALNIFIRTYYADSNPDVEGSLARAVREANSYILDVARTVPNRSGMGATLTAAVVRDDDLYLAQVGDSRCYLLRHGQLDQVTEDHSWVAEQVRAGKMTLEEAEQSPFRNVITRSMGGAVEVAPDLTAIKIMPGDRFLLCSDGLSGMVPDEEIARILSAGSPSVAAWNLVDRANQYGGKDNVTALVLNVLDVQPWSQEEAGAEVSLERADGDAPAPNGSGPAAAGDGSVAPEPLSEPVPAAPAGRGGLLRRLLHRV